jgi:hypothetical protein
MKARGRKKGYKQSKLVFENEQYRISEIPLNYQITVKIKKILGEPFYSDLDRGLDYAKETAE